jgi:hypothetical protein
MDTTSHKPLDKRDRRAHPKRITIANEVLERNDIRAKNLCMSERSLNRGDARGAPFVFLGGIKYRPIERHDQFILASIQQRKPERPKRRRANRGAR